ncbi:MAG: ThuA domain-containing protein [Phycisphaerales bacterium]
MSQSVAPFVRRARRAILAGALAGAGISTGFSTGIAAGNDRPNDVAVPQADDGPITAAAGAPDPADLVPGITFRIWDVDRPLSRVHEPAPDQSPNLDELRTVIDYPAQGDFGGFGDRFLVEVLGWLDITEAGSYTFRLTSDDGSLLVINDQRIIWNRGLHAPRPMDGAVVLRPGLHQLNVLMFEHEGGEMLRLEWRRPGQADFEIVPVSALRTEGGVTRVVAPGPKRLKDEIGALRPGDGLELAGPHPGWRIETIRPDGFDPMVGCLAVLPDGRLAVGDFEPKNNGRIMTEPNGTLYALSNLGAADRNDIKVEVIAEGLYHPLGLCVVDGVLYCAERDAITRLEDLDGDGRYESREVFAEGWASDNYHHFTFGLEHHDGWLYATLSTSINSATKVTEGKILGINGPNPPHRGTLLRARLSDGRVEFLAGGFRTPNGVLVTPSGDMFVGDNQGAWMPGNKINHVRPGRFYGHYNETRVKTEAYPTGGAPSLFSDRPPSPPAVWLPHNEIANSPTDFMLITDGAFAGQILASDVKLGGIRRAWFDAVDGELQGGAVRHSQGFEGGTNRLLATAGGTIIVGCIGERDTWSWRGTRTGLQRMVPTGRTAYEFERVSATPTGLRVYFTRPVPAGILESTDAWTIRQWRYVAGPDYGGPKRGEAARPVRSATASDDGLSVELVIPGLSAGHVVGGRFDGRSEGGERLHSTDFWYSLNRIPATTDAIQPADLLTPAPAPAPAPAAASATPATPATPAGEPNAASTTDAAENVAAPAVTAAPTSPLRVLVFSKTAGFRHGSIGSGVACVRELGSEHGFAVEHTEDATIFNDADLQRFGAVVFLNTTGNILDLSQEAAFQRFVRGGGGFVGVHSASDTEYDWSWYGGLVGAYFRQHPAVQEATIRVVDRDHPSTAHLGDTWVRTDEWYDFNAAPAPRVRRLLNLDESSYEGGRMGEDHPIAWCHEYDGGRSFYTGGGHTNEAFAEPDFRRHLLGGILWAASRVDAMPGVDEAAGAADAARVGEPGEPANAAEPAEASIAPAGTGGTGGTGG